MIAQYSRYIDEAKTAALLISGRGIFCANGAAQPWATDLVQCQSMELAARECTRSGRAAIYDAAGTPFLLVPLLDSGETFGAVAALAHRDLSELPSILRDMQDNSRYFSQLVHLLPQIILAARPDGTFDYASKKWSAVTGLSLDGSPVDVTIRRCLSLHLPDFEAQWRWNTERERDFSWTIPLATVDGKRMHKLSATPWRVGASIRKWIVSLEDVEREVSLRRALESATVRLQVLADIDAVLIDASLFAGNAVQNALERIAGALGGRWSATFTLGERPLSASAGSIDARRATAPRFMTRIGETGMLVATPRGPAAFALEDEQLIREIAARLTAALRGFNAFESERTTARVLQTSMLPATLPAPLAARFDVEYRPAKNTALVGGDWYDAFELRDGRVAFSIGDVVGHGLSSAVVMGHVRDTIRAYCMQDLSPGEVLEQMNASIASARGELVTAFIAVFDPLTLAVEYASAGHPPALLVRADGTIEETKPGGLILGVEFKETYDTHHRMLDSEAMVLYTDGLIESTHDLLAGEHRLRALLETWAKDHFALSATQLVDKILGDTPARDDIAMLILRLIHPIGLDTTILSTTRNATRARHAIERVLHQGVLGARTPDFVLAMSEAINNAVEHGSANDNDTVRFAVEWDGSGARGIVCSGGAWRDAMPSVERGRGLFLMRALSDKLHVDSGERGTTVKIVMTQQRAAS